MTFDITDECGVLLDVQPDDNDPANFTHFDTEEYDAAYEALQYSSEPLHALMTSVLEHWQESLGVDFGFTEVFDSVRQAVDTLGEMSWDIACMRLLERGFVIYRSDTMIEIYRRRHSLTD